MAGHMHAAEAADVVTCVADVAGLRQALVDWTDPMKTPDGTNTIIKLVRGSYVIDNAQTTHKLGQFDRQAQNGTPQPLTGSLQILGGYGVGCAESGRVVDASNTVIDGNNQTGAGLSLYGMLGDGLIEGVRFTHMNAGIYMVQYYLDWPTNYHYIMRSVLIDHNVFGGGYGLRIHATSPAGLVAVENSAIVNNDAAVSNFVDLTTGAGGTTNFIGNTVANNRASLSYAPSPPLYIRAAVLLQEYSAAITINMVNNVFHHNTSLVNGVALADLDVSMSNATNASAVVTAANNIYGTLIGTTTSATGNLDVNPRFVFPGGGDFHLLADSPAIDAGLDTLPGGLPVTDVEGNPRLNGAHVDIGAYEYGPMIDRIFGDDLGG